MANKLRRGIPNMITLCNLLSGCVAIYLSFRQGETYGGLTGLEWSWVAIGAAALFDFCDGLSARLLGAYSAVGKELDSLSDLVSFGVAPGMMMLNLTLSHSEHAWLCFAALAIPAFGALRLAIFNVDETQTTTFRGLPIPANAIFWIGMAAWTARYGYIGTGGMAVLMLLFPALMTSGVPMFSLKVKNLSLRDNVKQYALVASALLFVVLWGVPGLMWTIVLYVALSAGSDVMKRHA